MVCPGRAGATSVISSGCTLRRSSATRCTRGVAATDAERESAVPNAAPPRAYPPRRLRQGSHLRLAPRSGRREKVDGIAIRIAKQHRAIAPGHVTGLLQPVGHEILQARAFDIDVIDRELEDCRSVGGGRPRATMHMFGRLAADQGQNCAFRSHLDIVLVALRCDTEKLLVEGGEAWYVLGNEACIGESHGIRPFLFEHKALRSGSIETLQ